MMKRIAIWGYFGGYGGIEKMVYNIYRKIDKTKVQFDFLVPHDFGEVAFEKEILSMGGRIFRILYSERESLIKSRTCWKNYFKNNPEVIGVHVHVNFQYAFPLKMAKKANKKVRIIHSHNSSQLQKNSFLISRIRNWLVRRDIKKYPTHCVACGDAAAQFMFGNREYIWLKNGIELNMFAYNESIRNATRSKYGIKQDDIMLIQVGHLTSVKNPFYSLELMREVVKKGNNVKLFFIGEGPYKEEIENKIIEYKLEKNVFLLGVQKGVSCFYQAADALILPSLYEGFPVVLVESQTAGLKSYVSDNVSKQVAETDLCAFLKLEEKEKWIEAIIDLQKEKNRSIYKDIMQTKGYDIESVAREVEKIYGL